MSHQIAQLRRRGYGRTLIALVVIIIYMFPVYWMVATSFKTPAAIYASPPQIIPNPPTFQAYRTAVFDNPTVLRAIRNSTIIAGGTTLLTLLLAPPAAYALARLRPRGSGLVTLLLLIGQLLPGVVVAGPLFVLFSHIHLINSYQAIILADGTITIPFAVIVLRPFLLAVPRELESAAMVDGSTRFGAFFRIVLPLIRPGLITVGALSFLLAWGEFIFALSLNLNEDIAPVTVIMNKFVGQYGTHWDLMMAVATTVAIPIIAIFFALQRFIVGGLTTGAMKE